MTAWLGYALRVRRAKVFRFDLNAAVKWPPVHDVVLGGNSIMIISASAPGVDGIDHIDLNRCMKYKMVL